MIAQDPVARRQIGAALGAAGYEVREGATTDGVRAMIKTDAPDVLIVDLTGGGAETHEWMNLLARLTGDPQAARIPIVALVDRATPEAARMQMAFVAATATLVDKAADAAALQGLLGRVTGRGAALRLLVVDDDPLLARFLRQLLGQSQYELVEAQTGHAAIALLEGSQYDAVLLDLRMPGGSGYDVLRAVARDDRHAHLPIVVLTNYPTPDDAAERELLSSPVVIDLLSKPAVAARPQILLDRLRQLSGRTSPS